MQQVRLHLGPWGVGARSRAQKHTRVTRRALRPSTVAQRALPQYCAVLPGYTYVQIRAVNNLPVVSNAIYTPKKANKVFWGKVAIYTKIICLSSLAASPT